MSDCSNTTTTDTTFAVSKDGKYITCMRMSLWLRTKEKADKWDNLIINEIDPTYMELLNKLDAMQQITKDASSKKH